MKKVLIPTKLDKIARDLLTANGNYQVIQEDKKELAALVKEHPDVHALIVRSEKVTPQIIDALPSLKVVIRAGAGYNTIDIKHARQKDIDVMNTPGANANGVAEEVVTLMLASARHVIAADATTRGGVWEKSKFMGREIAGKTIGIVGLGNIGRLVAKRLSGFDCRMLGYDPVISEDKAAAMNVQLTDLATIFAESDYVTLHIPENEETRGLIDEKLLSRMKEGAAIVNCARAGIVNFTDLRKWKVERKLRYLNDVYEKDDAESAKVLADVCDIMMPHLGASTYEANWNAAKRAAEQLIEYDFKGVTSFIVNRDIPDGLDKKYCELANTLARLCRHLLGKPASLKQIETSFYGSLRPFADWLVVPIVAGIWEDFETSMDSRAARRYLEDMGIQYVNRDTDSGKHYESSITVDMTAAVESGKLRAVSVRGTVTEGMLIVSRIDEFAKLWFEPTGHTVLFLYDDRPGVLGTIGQRLAKAEINIEDVRNPHDSKTNHSLAIMKVNRQVPEEVVAEIAKEIQAKSAFSIRL